MRPTLFVFVVLLAVPACQPSADASRGATAEATTQSGAPSDSLVPLADSLLRPPDSTTRARFDSVMEAAASADLHRRPVGRIMQELGTQFLGAPYLTGTLDEPPEETLVVRLDGFDCVTFVETMLAMARGVRQQDTSYAGFARRLAQQRYRSGSVGYCQRLHYFTDWIAHNDARGLVDDRMDALGGRVLRDTIDFMSTHRSSYDRFATNDSLYRCVQDVEADLRARHRSRPIRYVPQDSIPAVYDQLRAGDVIALATSIDGLDVSHTGLAYAHGDGSFGLLHASTSGGVVVSPDLQRYVQQIDHQIGIVVARPVRGNGGASGGTSP
jgi:cell wall-associated NlpC family hydrolase